MMKGKKGRYRRPIVGELDEWSQAHLRQSKTIANLGLEQE